MPWSRLRRDFVLPITLSSNVEVNYILAPVSSIVHPLFIFKDYGDVYVTKHFCSLPKRNWAKYFDDKVVMAKNDVGAEEDSNEEDSDNNKSTEEDNDKSAEEDSEEVEESEVEEFVDDNYFLIASDQEDSNEGEEV